MVYVLFRQGTKILQDALQVLVLVGERSQVAIQRRDRLLVGLRERPEGVAGVSLCTAEQRDRAVRTAPRLRSRGGVLATTRRPRAARRSP